MTKRFFKKKQKRHFSCVIDVQLCTKNQKDSVHGFLEKASRTNGRTNGGELIGPICQAKGQKTEESTRSIIFQQFMFESFVIEPSGQISKGKLMVHLLHSYN